MSAITRIVAEATSCDKKTVKQPLVFGPKNTKLELTNKDISIIELFFFY